MTPISEVGRKAFIVGYRQGSNSQNERYTLLEVEGVSNRAETARFIGKRVVCFLSSGEKVQGTVVKVHGCKGRLIVRFPETVTRPAKLLGKTQ